MRVSADDNLKMPICRIHGDLFQIVQNVDLNAIDLRDVRLGKRGRPALVVVVAANRNDGSDRPQLLYHIFRPDITRMKNQIDPAEYLRHFGSHKSMSVGNDSDDLLSA